MTQQRKRPVINTTIAGYTQAVIAQTAKDLALPNTGVTLDFIVNDWTNLKRLAIAAAAPTPQEEPA